MNPELIKQVLIAALLKQSGSPLPVPPPPVFDPSSRPTSEQERAAMRKALQK